MSIFSKNLEGGWLLWPPLATPMLRNCNLLYCELWFPLNLNDPLLVHPDVSNCTQIFLNSLYPNVNEAVPLWRPSVSSHQHGRQQNFSRAGGSQHFAYPFSGCERCNANGPSQNAFYTTKKILWKHTLRSHFTKSHWGGVVFEFAKRLYFLSSFTAFAELGYHPIFLLLWTRQLSVNWT